MRTGATRSTPQRTYRLPILLALVEAGESARTSDVLARVYELIEDRLTAHDLRPTERSSCLVGARPRNGNVTVSSKRDC